MGDDATIRLADAGVVANDRQFATGDVTWHTARAGEQGVTLILRLAE